MRSEVRLGAAGGETTESRGFVPTASPRLPSLLDFDPSFFPHLIPSAELRWPLHCFLVASRGIGRACSAARHGFCRMLDCGGKRDADRNERGNDEDENDVYDPRVSWCCVFHGSFHVSLRIRKC